MNDTHVERHLQGMLSPSSDEEVSLAAIFGEVVRLSDRYKNDPVMMPAVVMIATGLMRLAGDGQTGRIDPTFLNKQVRDALTRAGVDASEL